MKRGEALTSVDLVRQLEVLGIKQGDDVLVHCSFSKIGAVEGGPQTLIDAFKTVIGEQGNLLMPSSPNAEYQLDYIRKLEVFDVDHEPSRMGAVSENFRKGIGVYRSAHPTEPVCVWGADASWYTDGHENDETAYGANSPFYRLTQRTGKILYIGVTLDNAGTSLHVLEDIVKDFKYPVYEPEIHVVKIKKGNVVREVKTKVHNPEQSKKRRCDQLLPLFEKEKVAKKCMFGEAETWIFDAERMLQVMQDAYRDKGITMYTPYGE